MLSGIGSFVKNHKYKLLAGTAAFIGVRHFMRGKDCASPDCGPIGNMAPPQPDADTFGPRQQQ